jgi:hypothetical protein
MILTVLRPYSISDRMINECGPDGGMKIGRRNLSTWRNPAPVPPSPPQIPHDLTWDQTQTTTVGSQRQTTRTVAQPSRGYTGIHI